MKKNKCTQRKYGICRDCSRSLPLTNHSLTGNHKPPFLKLCRDCHDKRDGIKPNKPKLNKKVKKGTHYGKNKKN